MWEMEADTHVGITTGGGVEPRGRKGGERKPVPFGSLGLTSSTIGEAPVAVRVAPSVSSIAAVHFNGCGGSNSDSTIGDSAEYGVYVTAGSGANVDEATLDCVGVAGEWLNRNEHLGRNRHFATVSRFWVSVRHARSGVGGHAWIAFHRCVENHARLTGQRFTVLFGELASRHGFGRGSNLPKPERLRAAVEEVAERHRAFLEELRRREAEQRALKRAGRREHVDPYFAELSARRAETRPPQVGYWGWRDRRG